MPLSVNGELISDDAVFREMQNMTACPEWKALAEGPGGPGRLKQAAEIAAVNRVLVRQYVQQDPRPISAKKIEAAVKSAKSGAPERAAVSDDYLVSAVELDLRTTRFFEEVAAAAKPPSSSEVRGFYRENLENFRKREEVHAAHIVRNIDEHVTEEEALKGIQEALAALESGEPFASVAQRLSDCKDNGGDLGRFPRGQMVEEFDAVVFALKVGERSPVFRTPFGFHIAEVRARDDGGIPSFESVRGAIEHGLKGMRARDAAQAVIGELRTAASIYCIAKAMA